MSARATPGRRAPRKRTDTGAGGRSARHQRFCSGQPTRMTSISPRIGNRDRPLATPARLCQQDDAAAKEAMELRAEQQADDRIDDVIEQTKAKARRRDAAEATDVAVRR